MNSGPAALRIKRRSAGSTLCRQMTRRGPVIEVEWVTGTTLEFPEMDLLKAYLQQLASIRTAPALLGLALIFSFFGIRAWAWDYEVHRGINQLALGMLPTNYPAFVKSPAAVERVGFLGGEADRWRNVQDLTFRHVNGPDHYIDVEELERYGLKLESLPPMRGDFIAQLAVTRKLNRELGAELEASWGRNEDHTRELIGLLPWKITEEYGRLKACFAYLRVFEEDGGRPEEILNAQEDVVYVMGVMGHFAGDAAQPLHTTIHHNGWAGANPKDYTTNNRIHSLVDSSYLARVGGADYGGIGRRGRVADVLRINGRPAKPEEVFQAVVLFVGQENREVEHFYQMEKEGKFSGSGETGKEGKAFLEEQILKGAQFLSDLWYTAWVQAPPDTFLKGQMAKRKKEEAKR